MAEDYKNQIFVFDVGGSHIAGGLFDPDTTTIGAIHTVPLRETVTAEEFLAAFDSLGKTVAPGSVASSGVAVAIPSPFDYERGVSYMQHKYHQLYGRNLRQGLAERLACEPAKVHFLNDAAAFLMGELYQGAAVGVHRAIGITLGTGVGSAFGVDGEIVVTGCGVPVGGEIWNLPYCDSSVENFISTRSIRRRYEQLAGKRVEVREIANLGFEHAPTRQTFEDFGSELGNVLRNICLEFAPRRIVLGGGISRAAPLFLPAAEKELAHPGIQLRVSDLFERAPLIGAGVRWMRNNLKWQAKQA